MRYRIMQTQETGEQVNVHETNCKDDAYDWIEDNADQYPESSFHVEPILRDVLNEGTPSCP